MEAQNIQLNLSLEDVNVILEALGKEPFQRVYGIIHSIHEQAQTQIVDTNTEKKAEAIPPADINPSE